MEKSCENCRSYSYSYCDAFEPSIKAEKVCPLWKQSYQTLESQNRKLREALQIGIQWMEFWLNENLCDCDDMHVCGKTERLAELKIMKEALKEVE